MSMQCDTLWINQTGHCVYPSRSLSDYSLTPCNSFEDCLMDDDTYTSCDCSFNGDKYCARGHGDPVYQLAFKDLMSVLDMNAPCHPRHRFSERCANITTVMQRVSVLLEYGLNAHRLVKAEPCVAKMFFEDIAKNPFLFNISYVSENVRRRYKTGVDAWIESFEDEDPLAIGLAVVLLLPLLYCCWYFYNKYKQGEAKNEDADAVRMVDDDGNVKVQSDVAEDGSPDLEQIQPRHGLEQNDKGSTRGS
eukprot:TRINITY_DN6094_c0_g1_i2.p1 TRINITY_DN6094_c0_g1~~TRINITY_DN6094_c0_g1_i2.p1  ORF type:complete len:248 (+),score=13.58 TRINITY_DN6094_c0_g1_i2:273-1016(+)